MTYRLGGLQLQASDLVRLGAVVDGEPFGAALLTRGGPKLQKDLANRIQFDEAQVERAMHTPERQHVVGFLTELAGERASSKPLVLRGTDVPNSTVTFGDLMNRQLTRITGVLAPAGSNAKKLGSNVVTYVINEGTAVRHTGVGLQVYGVYRGLSEMAEALVTGETTQAIIAGTSVAAEVGSLALEAKLPQLGTYLQRTDIPCFDAFNRSGLGKRLGGTAALGKGVSRSAGAAGFLLTLPFDVYSAVGEFKKAQESTGLEAQDAYVEAGFATASAVTSFALTGAAMAGSASASGVGIVAGAALAGGLQIYKSVRRVEDLSEHVNFSAGERIATGLASFFGMDPSQDIQDRFAVGKAGAQYDEKKRMQMQGALALSGDRYGIFGNARITAQPPRRSSQTTAVAGLAGTEHPISLTRSRQQPARVVDNAGDDDIDASKGLKKIANLVTASKPGKRGGLLWATGGGYDKLRGASDVSNTFELGEGRKIVAGGAGNDVFNLTELPRAGSSLDGAGGSDTLNLDLKPAKAGASPGRHAMMTRVTLPGASKVDSRLAPVPFGDAALGALYSNTTGVAMLRSIENVSTPAGGLSVVVGNDKANVFIMNGADRVKGGAGDDTYFVKGAGIKFIEPGQGSNTYHIERDVESVLVSPPSGSGRPQSRAGAQIRLDYDLGEFNVRAVDSNLFISLPDDKRVTLYGASRSDGKGGWQPSRAYSNFVIVTRDGFALTPVLQRSAARRSALVELVATRLADFKRSPAASDGGRPDLADAAELNRPDAEPAIGNILASLPPARS